MLDYRSCSKTGLLALVLRYGRVPNVRQCNLSVFYVIPHRTIQHPNSYQAFENGPCLVPCVFKCRDRMGFKLFYSRDRNGLNLLRRYSGYDLNN
jgi:hypothetical protein